MMNRRVVLSLILATFFGALPIHGDPINLGLQVTPGKLEISIPPGVSYNIPVTVHNSGFNSTHVLTALVDFGVNQNGDYEFKKVGSEPYSLLKWAALRPREFDLPANTTEQVQLTISVPQNSHLSGEYAGIVFFQTRPERRAGNAVAFSARVASKIYETIPNTVKIDGAITKMTAVASGGGEVYRVVFKNTGNAHVYARGQLMVQKGGSVVFRQAMPDNMLVERGGVRVIELRGKKLGAGTYQAIATMDYGGKTETGGQIQFDVR